MLKGIRKRCNEPLVFAGTRANPHIHAFYKYGHVYWVFLMDGRIIPVVTCILSSLSVFTEYNQCQWFCALALTCVCVRDWALLMWCIVVTPRGLPNHCCQFWKFLSRHPSWESQHTYRSLICSVNDCVRVCVNHVPFEWPCRQK